MTPYRQHVRLKEGCDYTFPSLPVLQADGVTLQNLTGYSARLSFYVNSSDERAQLVLTGAASAGGQVLLGGTLGTAYFTVARQALQTFLDRAGRWRLVVVSPSSATPPSAATEVASGTWTLEPSGP